MESIGWGLGILALEKDVQIGARGRKPTMSDNVRYVP